MPCVSICLPVYNGANYLSQALESVLAQTFDDFELLVANDCSTDETLSIIENYAIKDNRILAWTNDANLGLFGNYNACIKRAKGKYIKLFAHDDILQANALERLVSVLDEHQNVSLVSSARGWIDAFGQEVKVESGIEKKLTNPFASSTLLSGTEVAISIFTEMINWLGEPSSQMFRAEYIGGGFDESFKQVGDLDYNLRLLERGDYYFLSDQLCLFRKHPASNTTSHSRVLSSHLEWLFLASKYPAFLTAAGITSGQYCLNFIKAWTRDLEEQFYQDNRFDSEEIDSNLRLLCENKDPLSFFQAKKDGQRDHLSEYWAFGAIALLQTVLLENQIRVIAREVARPYQAITKSNGPITDIRPGLAAALQGLRETLIARDAEIDELRKAVETMGNSFSWKVTAPLRNFKAQLR
jgi:glycosyltransferase involved in cell wall biosynthesis